MLTNYCCFVYGSYLWYTFKQLYFQKEIYFDRLNNS